MPPMLNIAWNRDIVGFFIFSSTATACEFIATSFAPAMTPYINSAANSVARLTASAGNTSARQKPIDVQFATRELPYRLTSQPHTGIALTDPIAAPSSAIPSAPLDSCSSACTAGIRETQAETTSPCTRNRAATAHHADVNRISETRVSV